MPAPSYRSGRRVIAPTSWPASSSAVTSRLPTNPDAPVTRILIATASPGWTADATHPTPGSGPVSAVNPFTAVEACAESVRHWLGCPSPAVRHLQLRRAAPVSALATGGRSGYQRLVTTSARPTPGRDLATAVSADGSPRVLRKAVRVGDDDGRVTEGLGRRRSKSRGSCRSAPGSSRPPRARQVCPCGAGPRWPPPGPGGQPRTPGGGRPGRRP